MKTYLTNSNILRTETEQSVISNLLRKGWVECPQPSYNPENETVEWINGTWVILPIEKPSYSADEWLTSQGYNSVILITLLDLENKLKEQNKNSSKLASVRSWINGILSGYIANPEPKNNWPERPFNPQETVAEAFSVL